MAHDILLCEFDETDAFDVFQEAERLDESGADTVGEVDLGCVARHNHLGVHAHASQEHLQLSTRCVLCLVEDDDGVAQRAASHKSERSNLYDVLIHHFAQLLGRNHVLKCIIQRLKIGVYLLLHVAGQEAKLLACLYCRARQDDSPDLLILESTDGEGNAGVRFA